MGSSGKGVAAMRAAGFLRRRSLQGVVPDAREASFLTPTFRHLTRPHSSVLNSCWSGLERRTTSERYWYGSDCA